MAGSRPTFAGPQSLPDLATPIAVQVSQQAGNFGEFILNMSLPLKQGRMNGNRIGAFMFNSLWRAGTVNVLGSKVRGTFANPVTNPLNPNTVSYNPPPFQLQDQFGRDVPAFSGLPITFV